MNFFESELRKLFEDGQVMDDPTFSGRICMGTLSKDVRVRVQFITGMIASQYDALKISVLNRTEGAIDTHVLKLRDVLGKKSVPGNPNFREGVFPYIWDDHGEASWYAYQPNQADRSAIRKAVGQYLDVFRDRQPEQERRGPKLVYICARPCAEMWSRISNLPDRRPRRSFRMGTSRSAPTSCSRLLQTQTTRCRISRHGRLAYGWWSPVSRSMFTARSGPIGCGRRSTTPTIWASL